MTRRALIKEASEENARHPSSPRVVELLEQAKTAPRAEPERVSVTIAYEQAQAFLERTAQADELPAEVEAIILDELPGYWGPDSAAADLARRVARRVLGHMTRGVAL